MSALLSVSSCTFCISLSTCFLSACSLGFLLLYTPPLLPSLDLSAIPVILPFCPLVPVSVSHAICIYLLTSPDSLCPTAISLSPFLSAHCLQQHPLCPPSFPISDLSSVPCLLLLSHSLFQPGSQSSVCLHLCTTFISVSVSIHLSCCPSCPYVSAPIWVCPSAFPSEGSLTCQLPVPWLAQSSCPLGGSRYRLFRWGG